MKMNLNKCVIFLYLLSAVSVVFAGANIASPGVTATSDGENVTIAWQTTEETNLKQFVIQRKSKNGVYMDLATLKPETDQYYEYVDETAYKTTSSVYIYRVAIIDNDGTVTYSEEVSVLHDTINGGVKETWGSIKALFR